MDILDGDGDGPYDTYHNAPYTLLRSLRLLRLLRVVPSLVRNDAQLVQRSTPRMLATLLRFNPSVLRLAQLTACLLCSCHWLGCMWWFVGTLECNVYHDPDEVSICEEDGWGPTAELQRVGTDMRGFLEKYNTAFLWGASVMTGFVPFDIEPETPAEVLATTLSLFCGLVMNIITIASAVSVLQSLDHKWGQINERLSNVNAVALDALPRPVGQPGQLLADIPLVVLVASMLTVFRGLFFHNLRFSHTPAWNGALSFAR